MQASKHVPVMLHNDRVWSALVQVPEMDQFNLDFPISVLLQESCRVHDWLSKSKMLL